jgi:hypothetical protein
MIHHHCGEIWDQLEKKKLIDVSCKHDKVYHQHPRQKWHCGHLMVILIYILIWATFPLWQPLQKGVCYIKIIWKHQHWVGRGTSIRYTNSQIPICGFQHLRIQKVSMHQLGCC